MKVLILHNTLNSCGGGERVALHTIKALQDASHEVDLGVVERTDWKKVIEITGIKLSRIPHETYLTEKLRTFGIYQRLLLSYYALKLAKKYDLMINTHGDAMITSTHVTYMHFPTLLMVTGEWVWYTKYGKNPFWRAYFEPYKLLQNFLSKRALENTILLTNSKFSKNVIKKWLGKEALVVYPPVELHDYLPLAAYERRDDVVISIGRFAPEKNWHLLPKIASKLPDTKFYLIGSLSGYYKSYFEHVLRLKEKLNAENLLIYPNAPHKLKLKLLSEAKVLLHLYPYEHFGISVVEGQASGCIPVIHKSGGQWLDIAENGKYGIGYDRLDINDILECVKNALSRWSLEEASKMSAHSLKFSDDRFRNEILKIAERCAE
ncbi:MAG: hypothetical protein DRJ38_08570 [Thermoprotei archaeon]|nr:MAG: hypothetical protein DRJ38_08570 [Thermoprotei archaeon]